MGSSQAVARMFFPETTDLTVLELNADKLAAPVRWQVGTMEDMQPDAVQREAPGALRP